MVIVHQHPFHTVAILQAEEELHRIIQGALTLFKDGHRLSNSRFLQLFPKGKG